jgi:hypothetical protein
VLAGCATVNPQLVDSTNRIIPTPNYTAAIVGTPITVLFYCEARREVVDLDGTKVLRPEYLKFVKNNTLWLGDYKEVILHIEVNNPTEIKYALNEIVKQKFIKNKTFIDMQTGGLEKKSNLQYRHFVYKLPFGEDLRSVDHLVTFEIDGQMMLQTHFRYKILQREEVIG